MSEKNPFRRYTISIVAVMSLNLGLIAAFNAAIDPYGILPSDRIVGINNIKPDKNTKVRLFKAANIADIEVQSIILGSSRTEFGIDPSHPALDGDRGSYNLAITGGNMYEVKRYFDRAIATQPNLNQIVLGLDFFMFNKFRPNAEDFKESRLEHDITTGDLFDSLLSFDAILSSIRTVLASRREPQAIGHFYPDGRRNPSYYIQYVYFNAPTKARFKLMLTDFLERPDLYQRYELSADYLNSLAEIIQMSQERGIELKIFMSPSHATQWEAIRAAGLWPKFEAWKRAVVELAPVWDFSGYNSITTEAIAPEMNYYLESSHYRKAAGDLLVNRMFDYDEEMVPSDFGTFVTPANLNAHLEGINRDREVWANTHPELVQWVGELSAAAKEKAAEENGDRN